VPRNHFQFVSVLPPVVQRLDRVYVSLKNGAPFPMPITSSAFESATRFHGGTLFSSRIVSGLVRCAYFRRRDGNTADAP
jgi:hypothetical protein